MRRLCLEETQDNEMIFNPRPSQARSTPVIVDGAVKEGSPFHLKPDNYCTNDLLCCVCVRAYVRVCARVCLGVVVRAGSGEYAAVYAPAEAGAACWNSCSTPLFPCRYLTSCRVCNLYPEEGREKNSQKLLIAQQKRE